MSRNFMRLALLNDTAVAGTAGGVDPVTGEEITEEKLEELSNASPEEDVQRAVEAGEALEEAQSAAVTVEQMTLRALRLEDAAEILDAAQETNGGVDGAHVALATTIADLVADGDGEATQSIVAIDGTDGETLTAESFKVRRTFSTEGIKDAARRIWEAIKAFVKKIWEKIETFFHKYFGRIPRLRKAVKAMIEKLEDKERFPLRDKNIDITSATSQLLIDNKEVREFGTYLKAFAVLKDIATDVFKKYAENDFVKRGEAMADAISDYDASATDVNVHKAALGKINDTALTRFESSGARIENTVSMSQPDIKAHKLSEGYEYSISPALPGNFKLCVRTYSVKRAQSMSRDTTSGELTMSARIRNTGLFALFPDRAKEAPSSVNMKTPSIDVVVGALNDCLHLLDDMEDFYRGKVFKDIKKNNEKISKAAEKLAASFDKVSSEDRKADCTPYVRAAMSYNSSYVSQVMKAFTTLEVQCMTSTNFLLHVGNKTAAAYRERE